MSVSESSILEGNFVGELYMHSFEVLYGNKYSCIHFHSKSHLTARLKTLNQLAYPLQVTPLCLPHRKDKAP